LLLIPFWNTWKEIMKKKHKQLQFKIL